MNEHSNCCLTLSLPNATVVEITVHCQTQLQSKFIDTIDSCQILTVVREKRFVLYYKMLRQHNNIVYGGLRNFCTRMEFTKKIVMSLDFAEIENNENMSKGMTYRTH